MSRLSPCSFTRRSYSAALTTGSCIQRVEDPAWPQVSPSLAPSSCGRTPPKRSSPPAVRSRLRRIRAPRFPPWPPCLAPVRRSRSATSQIPYLSTDRSCPDQWKIVAAGGAPLCQLGRRGGSGGLIRQPPLRSRSLSASRPSYSRSLQVWHPSAGIRRSEPDLSK